MKIIMLKDVGGVAQRNTIKDVADGYALNFLIPQGLAVQASDAKITALEMKIKEETNTAQKREGEWKEQVKKLDGIRITISANTNNQGHLYKQLSAEDVSSAVKKETKIVLDTKSIIIKMPIKTTGESIVEIQLGKSRAHVTLDVRSV